MIMTVLYIIIIIYYLVIYYLEAIMSKETSFNLVYKNIVYHFVCEKRIFVFFNLNMKFH
jgi:hypothetical protein